MHEQTRQQLLQLSRDFYRAHASGFDESRGHQPWPGWESMAAHLGRDGPLRVLDVGCGNARLATFLAASGFSLRYVGIDSNAALLDAARERLDPALRARCELIEGDFLAEATPTEGPGSALPEGPFDLVALFGVLHHVPGEDWRVALVRESARRLAPDGVLALAAWQFAGRARFEKRQVEWSALPEVLGKSIDPAQLEVGDHLLRFGSDPTLPPRYCHQVSALEFAALAELPELTLLAEYAADGREGDLNRYQILKHA